MDVCEQSEIGVSMPAGVRAADLVSDFWAAAMENVDVCGLTCGHTCRYFLF